MPHLAGLNWLAPRVDAAVSVDLHDIWSQVRDRLVESVDPSTFRTWLDPIVAVSLDRDRLVLAAPERTAAWIGDRFGDLLQATAATVLGPETTVEVRSGGPSPTPHGSVPNHARPPGSRGGQPAPGATAPTGASALATSLNPAFTFDSFVIGDSNRLAHAAALAVAEMPSAAYNPLFLSATPGLGKTHLLHSIAAYIAAHSPTLSVRCTTGEAFTTAFVAALAARRIEEFKASFRQLDVLLIDDVHFLERKARTEEEFLHTFNALYDSGAQLVFTSDRLPEEIGEIEERLRKRFAAGLVADVREPDHATRVAILRKRALAAAIDVPDKRVLEEIAARVNSDVRALEGALIRVVAYASLTGRELTTEIAQDVLDRLYPGGGRRPRSISDVIGAICEHFGIAREELISSARSRRVAWPRHLAMYLCRELTDASLPDIGRALGGRDHTTVLYATRRAASRISLDSDARHAADELRALLT